MKILVTGGCGFKGHVLVPKLLARGYEVVVIDTLWFGNFLEKHSRLNIIQIDIRNLAIEHFTDVDIVIHLASIANDPCGDLNSKLTWEVNALATMTLVECAKSAGVNQIIYASSGSVYGVSDAANVTEELPLKPISDYNKTKMISERILLSYFDHMKIQILRPATVCGVSPRMRFDVAVNLLAMQALSVEEITVLGGDQVRPNVHIDDITDAYLHFIDNPEFTGIYNIVFENLSLMDIAKIVQNFCPAKIKVLESQDPRSYRVDSSKIIASGFSPKKTVNTAIIEIKEMFDNGSLKNQTMFNNLLWMKENGIAQL